MSSNSIHKFMSPTYWVINKLSQKIAHELAWGVKPVSELFLTQFINSLIIWAHELMSRAWVRDLSSFIKWAKLNFTMFDLLARKLTW